MAKFLEKKGDTYGDFKVVKVHRLEELQMTLREIVYGPTCSHILHLESQDRENLFCLSFRTLPKNSNGVPHILEHTVLCGSKKYPVKDPFFAMNRRSLNTFMNAMTGSDFTCYPASTQNEKDFYNLLEVYLDAVFHPQLKRKSFLQEGHRFAFEDPKDPNTPLTYQGIVFNEMKGSYSSPDTRLWQTVLKELCPDLPYSHNSGGNPKEIPDLSYDELIEFHDTYYHPSNCLFFFYGNLPLKGHLDCIHEHALKNVEHGPPHPAIPRQTRFTSPKFAKESYPIAESEDLTKKTMISFNWLTAHISEQDEVLALTLLDSVLMDTDASPLKHAILQSGLCRTVDAFIDPEITEVPYGIVCKGCEESDAEKIYEVIETTLKGIVKSTIPQELIESSLHQLEFSRSEIVGNHMPYGLTLFMRSALAKQHGCPPENALLVHTLFKKLRQDLQDPHYLTNLIEKHFLNNPHRVNVILAPSHTLGAEEVEEEKQRLAAIKASLSEAQKEGIVKQSEELEKYQFEAEDQSLECLPKVTLDDVPELPDHYELHTETFKGIKLFHHNCFTNKILYTSLNYDLPNLSEEELPYVHLFTYLFNEMGCADRSYLDNLKMLHAHTGGISAFCSLYPQVENPHIMKPSLQIHGKTLLRNQEPFFKLLKDMVTSVRFDEYDRLKEVILQIYTSLQNRLNRNALRYATQLAMSALSPVSYIGNAWYGLKYFETIRHIVDNIDTELPKVAERLTSLKERLLGLKNPHLVIGADQAMYDELKQADFFGLPSIGGKSFQPWEPTYELPKVQSQARAISSPVAFTCQAYKAISFLHPLAPALYVACFLMENKVLHRAIREQGGAYGGGAHYNASTGLFYFHSYRDPNLYSTLDAFTLALEEIAGGNFDDRELEEAKLGMVQGLDAPVPPGARSMVSYGRAREGKTFEMRKKFRANLLAVTSHDIETVLEKELLAKKDQAITISFAENDFFDKAAKTLTSDQKPLPIFPV